MDWEDPGEGNDNPLLYASLGNPMDRAVVVGYSPCGHKSWIQLSDSNHYHLENTQYAWGHTERSRVWGEKEREIQRQKERREEDRVTQRQRMSEQAFIEGGNLGFLGLSHYW